MDFDAFTAGVAPGGLRNRGEIRILICYLLASVDAPLSKDDIVGILQENSLANYFEVTDALSDLEENGNITADKDKVGVYTAAESAHLIARQLDTALPVSVRERTISAALNLLARVKREQENRVAIEQSENGCMVHCHISGGDMDLMSFSLYVPDMPQAKMVKKNFQEDPERVYRCMLALVTGNRDLAADLIDRP